LAEDKTAYRTYCNQVSRLSKKLRARYYEKKVEQLHETWWKQVKKFLNIKQNSVYSALDISPNTSVPNAINEFFASVSGDLEPLRPEFLAKLTDDYSSQFIIEVAEVETKLSNINIYKAPGPNHLPSWILRDFTPLIAEPLAAIFNTSIRQGKVPDIWKSAVVIPAPKIHPPRSISSDFRPISLLSVLAKVLESFVANWLHDLLDPVLDPNQFGCLKGRSTAHALISVLHHWSQTLDKRGSVRALFVDFSKAFDRVNHNVIVSKVIDRGVPHCLIRWICSYLNDRRQSVCVDGQYSNWLSLTGGMPQGSLIGPLTFILLIDDLRPQCLTHKYVDDTTLTELYRADHLKAECSYIFKTYMTGPLITK